MSETYGFVMEREAEEAMGAAAATYEPTAPTGGPTA